jgi:molybdopterin-containing oxidoreductase family iron-sulfur binding subunit
MVDVQTSCQQACPTNAIVFGNANDKDSMISTTRADHAQRVFYALEELHVIPNVNYLAKVRHSDGAYGHVDAEQEMIKSEKQSTIQHNS